MERVSHLITSRNAHLPAAVSVSLRAGGRDIVQEIRAGKCQTMKCLRGPAGYSVYQDPRKRSFRYWVASQMERVSSASTRSTVSGDTSEEGGGKPSFQEWMDSRHADLDIMIREYPTYDKGLSSEEVKAIAAIICDLFAQGRTVIVVDSAGASRTQQVANYFRS